MSFISVILFHNSIFFFLFLAFARPGQGFCIAAWHTIGWLPHLFVASLCDAEDLANHLNDHGGLCQQQFLGIPASKTGIHLGLEPRAE